VEPVAASAYDFQNPDGRCNCCESETEVAIVNSRISAHSTGIIPVIAIVAIACFIGIVAAQDRLPQYPVYSQFQKMSSEIRGAVKMGSLTVAWKDGGASFDYQLDGKTWHYDIASRKATEIAAMPPQTLAPGGRGRGTGAGVGSGRIGSASFARAGQQLGGGGIVRQQTTSASSPDNGRLAFSRDGNLWLSDPDGSNEVRITTDGNEKARIRYGVATIIYGEELGMSGGIFWSQDGSKLAYYGFDES
jgi:dipeptidyl-peptidase-4